MRIVTDTKLVNRNVTIGRYASLGGIALIIGALFINIYAISRPQVEQPQLLIYVVAAFVIGYMLSNLGGALNFRWGRRPDRGLSDALRGLDDRHTLYNHRLGANHVLVAPSGVFVLVPKFQGGPIAYEDGKWKNPGERRGLFSFFAPRDVLGNPTAEAVGEAAAFKSFLKKQAPDTTLEPKPIVVFMNARAIVEAKGAPVTALHVKQLKDYVRRQTKGATLPASALAAIEEKLGIAEPQQA
ncbi:MAG: hypothetical protein ACT4QE_15505 [Anaerolineales bacterium]